MCHMPHQDVPKTSPLMARIGETDTRLRGDAYGGPVYTVPKIGNVITKVSMHWKN